MAFSILSALFRDDSEKYATIAPNSEGVVEGAPRGAVLRKTMPSRRLTDQANPHNYINKDKTDIRRHWRK